MSFFGASHYFPLGKEIKLGVGKKIKLVATLYTPVSHLLPIFQISETIFGKMGDNFSNFPGMGVLSPHFFNSVVSEAIDLANKDPDTYGFGFAWMILKYFEWVMIIEKWLFMCR